MRQDIKKRKSFQSENAEAPYRSKGKKLKDPSARTLYTPGPTRASSTSMGKRYKNNTFMSAAKQRVIELLMQNDQVLLFLYEKLFPVTSTQSNSHVSLGVDRLYSAEGQPQA